MSLTYFMTPQAATTKQIQKTMFVLYFILLLLRTWHTYKSIQPEIRFEKL